MQIETDILITWGATIKEFCKGEIIFMEGDEARRYYQIIHGEVKLFNTNNEGKEFTQGIFYDGNSFGEPPLFIDEPYPATAVAVKDSVIIKLSRESYFKILDEYPALQKTLLKEFAQRIVAMCREYLDLVSPDIYRPEPVRMPSEKVYTWDLLISLFKKRLP